MTRLGFERPRAARGFVPLVLGAIAAGNAIYKGVSANQRKQRNKGYIEDAYRSASQRQSVHESDVRQGQRESLNARGILTPGSNTGASLTASAYAPRTLGAAQQADTNRELGLERTDLENARRRAHSENKADYLNSLVGSVADGVGSIASAYSMAHMPSVAPGGTPTPAFQGLVDSPPVGGGSMIGGAYGIDPLTGKAQGTRNGIGQSNFDFNVG